MDNDHILFEVRRRDMSDSPCPVCFVVKLRVFSDNEVICFGCNKVFPRYMTKAELIAHLVNNCEEANESS